MNKTIWWGLGAMGTLLFLLFTLAYFFFRSSQSQTLDSILQPVKFSEFTVQSESGDLVSFSKLINDKQPIFLSFWATWCEPCLEEIPKIQSSSLGTNATILWINLDVGSFLDRAKLVKEWKEVHKISLETYYDHRGQLQETFHISGLPLNVLMSQDGKIHFAQMGLLKESDIARVTSIAADL